MKKLALSFCAAVFALATSSAQANLLTAGDFEGLSLGPRASTGFNFSSGTNNQWRVDGYSIVTAQNGITPFGNQMLSFISGGSNDTYQAVDVSSFASSIDGGGVTADVSAFFNATGANDVNLRLIAFGPQPTSGLTGMITDNLLDNPFYAGNSRTDSNVATWELFQLLDVVIPVSTRFLVVGIHSDRDFASYIDNVSLTLSGVPAPGAALLLGFGLIGLSAARRR